MGKEGVLSFEFEFGVVDFCFHCLLLFAGCLAVFGVFVPIMVADAFGEEYCLSVVGWVVLRDVTMSG